MYCPNCGTRNEESACYCADCGTFIEARVAEERSAQESPGAFAQTSFNPQPTIDCFASAIEKSQYRAEAERLRKSLMACRIGGIICALTFASIMAPYAGAGMPILFAMGFLAPYGFAPLRRWIDAHGYVIVFNWIFLLVAFMLAITFAIIAGPIYAVYAHMKIAEYEKLAR